MKTIETAAPESTAVMELDLMPYINALINARWIVIIAALLSAMLAGAGVLIGGPPSIRRIERLSLDSPSRMSLKCELFLFN